MSTYSKTAIFNASALGTFAVGTALILGLTYIGTKAPIAESERIAEESALREVVGDLQFDNDLLSDLIELNTSQTNSLNIDSSSQARVIRNEGEILGFIFPATAPDGYSGDIDLIVGINTAGELLGVRTVNHKETPGLGDKIDTKKSDWILDFQGLSLTNPEPYNWAVKKDGGDFDAFTGATITPRAVVNIIKSSLEQFQSDSEQLIALASLQTETVTDNISE